MSMVTYVISPTQNKFYYGTLAKENRNHRTVWDLKNQKVLALINVDNVYLLKKQTKEICNHISTNSKHSSKGKLLEHVGCSSFFAKQSASKNTGKETRVSVRIGLFLVPCSYLCGFMEGLTHSRNYLIEADMTP